MYPKGELKGIETIIEFDKPIKVGYVFTSIAPFENFPGFRYEEVSKMINESDLLKCVNYYRNKFGFEVEIKRDGEINKGMVKNPIIFEKIKKYPDICKFFLIQIDAKYLSVQLITDTVCETAYLRLSRMEAKENDEFIENPTLPIESIQKLTNGSFKGNYKGTIEKIASLYSAHEPRVFSETVYEKKYRPALITL